MKKTLLTLTIILIFQFTIFAENNDYNLSKIGNISVGNSNGMIGYKDTREYSIAPQTFTIYNSLIYIPDPVNNKLSVFSTDLNFQYSIYETEDNYLAGAEKLIVTNNEDIIYLVHDFGLKKINKTGETISCIDKTKLPNELLAKQNFFNVNDNIYFYSDEGEIGIISDSIIIHDNTRILNNLQSIQSKNNTNTVSNSINLSKNSIAQLNTLQQNLKYLIIDNSLYSTVFKKHKEYYQEISSIRTDVVNNSNLSKSIGSENMNINYNNFYMWFIGYDNSHNSYWEAFEKNTNENNNKKQLIVVIDKYGILLDTFQYGETNTMNDPIQITYPASGAKLAVAPTGDVWFMTASPKGYDFYKVSRQW